MAVAMQIKEKACAAVQRGESMASVARRFEVGERSVRRWVARMRETGDLTPKPSGPRGHTKLTDADVTLVLTTVQRRPGVTLRELAEAVSVDVAESTVCRLLLKLGYSFINSVCSRRNSNGRTSRNDA